MPRVMRLLPAPIIFLGVALAGCSASVSVESDRVIPKAAVEKDITTSLEESVGQRPDSVECPGDLPGEQGEVIRCVLRAGADSIGVTATVTSASVQDGKLGYHLDVQVDDKKMS